MDIKKVQDKNEKTSIARYILESLPDYFGIVETREQYIRDSADRIMIAAFDSEKPVGFLNIKQTGDRTAEIAVMGILKEYHRKGIGRRLVETAENELHGQFSFLQVKTVKMGVYQDYDMTNLFYKAMGFSEFEIMEDLWDEANPCQIYVKYLG